MGHYSLGLPAGVHLLASHGVCSSVFEPQIARWPVFEPQIADHCQTGPDGPLRARDSVQGCVAGVRKQQGPTQSGDTLS